MIQNKAIFGFGPQLVKLPRLFPSTLAAWLNRDSHHPPLTQLAIGPYEKGGYDRPVLEME